MRLFKLSRAFQKWPKDATDASNLTSAANAQGTYQMWELKWQKESGTRPRVICFKY